jgi:hypothetical protein
MSELQALESIIKNKPEGFLSYRYNYKSSSGITFNRENWHSLADIEKQIDQLKEIDSLRKQLAEMTSAFNSMDSQNRHIVWDNVCLNEQLASAKVFVKAMAHVGVDFGYGPYALTETDVCDARGFLEQLQGKG